jgi:hypothetical protein
MRPISFLKEVKEKNKAKLLPKKPATSAFFHPFHARWCYTLS